MQSRTQPLWLREQATTLSARAETRVRKMPAGGTAGASPHGARIPRPPPPCQWLHRYVGVASGTHLSIPQNTILGGPELVRPRPSQPCPPPRCVHRPALSIHHPMQRWRARDVDNVLCTRTVLLLLRLRGRARAMSGRAKRTRARRRVLGGGVLTASPSADKAGSRAHPSQRIILTCSPACNPPMACTSVAAGARPPAPTAARAAQTTPHSSSTAAKPCSLASDLLIAAKCFLCLLTVRERRLSNPSE